MRPKHTYALFGALLGLLMGAIIVNELRRPEPDQCHLAWEEGAVSGATATTECLRFYIESDDPTFDPTECVRLWLVAEHP